MRVSSCRQDDDGFTLVELLVVIVLVGIIGGTVVTSVVRSLDVTQRATSRVEALTDMQRAMERMSRNIRVAEPQGSSPLVLTAATGSSIAFTVFDPVTRREIVYTQTGDRVVQLTRTFASHTATTAPAGATTTVIDGLDQGLTPVFGYFKDDGSALAATDGPADIVRVQIRLRRQTADDLVELSSSTFLRNTLD